MKRPRFELWKLADVLRLVASVSLLVLALALFGQPIRQVVGPKLQPVVQKTPLPRLLGSGADKGFMVKVISQPLGATVTIDGAERGTTPLFANVPCKEGQSVKIVVAKAGSSPWSRTVPCRVGKELTVQARF